MSESTETIEYDEGAVNDEWRGSVWVELLDAAETLGTGRLVHAYGQVCGLVRTYEMSGIEDGPIEEAIHTLERRVCLRLMEAGSRERYECLIDSGEQCADCHGPTHALTVLAQGTATAH